METGCCQHSSSVASLWLEPALDVGQESFLPFLWSQWVFAPVLGKRVSSLAPHTDLFGFYPSWSRGSAWGLEVLLSIPEAPSSFKMHSSVVLVKLGNHHHSLIAEHLYHPEKQTPCPCIGQFSVPSTFSPNQPLNSLLSHWIYLFSYKWNHITCGSFCLVPFT